jgi:hypothetical protein
VNQFFHTNLAVININDTFVNSPEAAACAIRNLIGPKAVIPSHANEVATTGGAVNPGTRTASFIELLRQPPNGDDDAPAPSVFVPLERRHARVRWPGAMPCRLQLTHIVLVPTHQLKRGESLTRFVLSFSARVSRVALRAALVVGATLTQAFGQTSKITQTEARLELSRAEAIHHDQFGSVVAASA